MNSGRAWLLIAGTILGAGLAVYVLVPVSAPPTPPTPPGTPPPEDPRLTYSGPYRNVHPDVKYVGDAVCADCHMDKAETFAKHPMGRSLAPMAQAPTLPPIDAKHHNPFPALGSTFRVDKDAQRWFQREIRADAAGKSVYENVMEAHYVMGSGNHGHSFLCDRDGYVFQTPISWYSSKQIWDLSPGWTSVGAGRPVQQLCLYCHANRVEPMVGYLNRYQEPLFRGHSIGCERCHGPGEKHVAAWSGSDNPPKGQDVTIVSPAKLAPELRESVCQQCHLEGERRVLHRGRTNADFRPGLPLDAFWSTFVRPDDEEDYKAVTHVEQMYHSGCFRGSAREKPMGCISCHDPHVKVTPAERVAHYRQSCLQCHAVKGCSVPEVERRKSIPGDSCVDCHMQKFPTSDIAHTASTDHRILRRPDPNAGMGGNRPAGTLQFFPKRSDKDLSDEDQRDLGVALASLAYSGRINPRSATEGLKLLEAALQRQPRDVDALDAKASALLMLTRRQEALTTLEAALTVAPNQELILNNAAVVAQALDRLDVSLGYWRRAVEMNPWQPHYHGNIANILLVQRDYEGARRHGEQWLKLDPGNIDARKFWIDYWLKTGEKDKAKAEMAKIEAINPPNLEDVKTWFARKMR